MPRPTTIVLAEMLYFFWEVPGHDTSEPTRQASKVTCMARFKRHINMPLHLYVLRGILAGEQLVVAGVVTRFFPGKHKTDTEDKHALERRGHTSCLLLNLPRQHTE